MGVCHKLELFGDAEYQKMKPLKQSNSVLGLIVGVNLRIVVATNSTNYFDHIIWSICSITTVEIVFTLYFGENNEFYILPWPIIYGPWKIILLTYEKWYDLWMAWISCWNISLLSPLDTSSGIRSLPISIIMDHDIFHVLCSILYASYCMNHTIWLLLLSTSREFWKRTNPWKSVLLQDDLMKYYSFDDLSLFFDVQVLEIIEQEWP